MQATSALRTVQLPARTAVRIGCSSKRAAVRCARACAMGPSLQGSTAGQRRAGSRRLQLCS